ncbi:hypothetical protein Q3G72_010692 [Acer saccharum]|nr:hypothetical protein Q3G72_010692 [Acer saccharum]
MYLYPIRFLDTTTNTTASFSCRFSSSILPSSMCPFGDGFAFLITSNADLAECGGGVGKQCSEDDAFRTNPAQSKDGPAARTGLSGIRILEEGDGPPSRRLLKRMSSPERWEAKQLIASGFLTVNEYPMYDEKGDGMMYQEEGAEEELEIEMNEDEPAFLQGQTRY